MREQAVVLVYYKPRRKLLEHVDRQRNRSVVLVLSELFEQLLEPPSFVLGLQLRHVPQHTPVAIVHRHSGLDI